MRLDHLLSKEEEVGVCVLLNLREKVQGRKYLVAMRMGETPVPIPNTTVKPHTAESTMLETAWEGRWLPGFLWGCSSVGRAPALQAGGQEFESLHLHSHN